MTLNSKESLDVNTIIGKNINKGDTLAFNKDVMPKMSSLKQDVVNKIHKPAQRNFLRRRVQVRSLNDLIQADLVEMIPYARENSGCRYILVVINVFSKYVWAEAVKRKNSEDISNAMRRILKQMKSVPKNCQTDMGKETWEKNSITKSSVVERVNRTLKNLMLKQFSLQGNYKWLALLPKIVHKYNNTRHRTIKMKPSEVNNENELILLEDVYGNNRKMKRNIKAGIFKKGDYVRISKYREAFAKGYTPNWSNEIFIIRKVNYTYPPTYLLADQNGQDIEGSFYREELQKTLHNDVYLIEKVVRRNGNKLLVNG
ncbi:hypothetical protein NQ315_013997 [Exocentrus adspersus]|uniref:Integrase catalytic domain-containing protein n=1 Tax=Exocentrus adspersus TaxID=1586481 RepID=A0AAV8VHH9_9CUCU|nr:hypothetical protein NQ315_013997 [Exocentrus adspersus]